MKTAEEWDKEINQKVSAIIADCSTIECPLERQLKQREYAINFYKQIQLDAWKQGMSEALKIHQEYPPSEHYECSKEITNQLSNREEI